MRSDMYSEWDEYIGLNTLKRVMENAISQIAGATTFINKESEIPEDLKNYLEKLDIVRVSLIAVRNELDHCEMVGTCISKNGVNREIEEVRTK